MPMTQPFLEKNMITWAFADLCFMKQKKHPDALAGMLFYLS